MDFLPHKKISTEIAPHHSTVAQPSILCSLFGATAALLLFSCAPKLDRGPTAAERYDAPITPIQVPPTHTAEVYFQALIHAGSAFDPPGREGLAALTAYRIAPMGAEVEVDREWVSLRLRCHTDHQARCADQFVKALQSPSFDPDPFPKLIKQESERLSMQLLSSEERLGEEVFHQAVFDAHPYGHAPLGRFGSLSVLTPDHVQQFYRSHYRQSTVFVGFAGNYSTQTEAVLAELTLPGGKPPELLLPHPISPQERQLIIIQTDLPSTRFTLGHALPIGPHHPDWAALTVGIAALSQRAPELRGQLVLPQRDLMLTLQPTSTANAPAALHRALQELERLLEDGVSEDELAFINHSKEITKPSQQLNRKLFERAVPNPVFTGEVTAESIRAALHAYVHPKKLWIIATSNDSENLRRSLLNTRTGDDTNTDVSENPAHPRQDMAISTMNLGLSADNITIRSSRGVFR